MPFVVTGAPADGMVACSVGGQHCQRALKKNRPGAILGNSFPNIACHRRQPLVLFTCRASEQTPGRASLSALGPLESLVLSEQEHSP